MQTKVCKGHGDNPPCVHCSLTAPIPSLGGGFFLSFSRPLILIRSTSYIWAYAPSCHFLPRPTALSLALPHSFGSQGKSLPSSRILVCFAPFLPSAGSERFSVLPYFQREMGASRVSPLKKGEKLLPSVDGRSPLSFTCEANFRPSLMMNAHSENHSLNCFSLPATRVTVFFNSVGLPSSPTPF